MTTIPEYTGYLLDRGPSPSTAIRTFTLLHGQASIMAAFMAAGIVNSAS
jgi:hypothetical protein